MYDLFNGTKCVYMFIYGNSMAFLFLFFDSRALLSLFLLLFRCVSVSFAVVTDMCLFLCNLFSLLSMRLHFDFGVYFSFLIIFFYLLFDSFARFLICFVQFLTAFRLSLFCFWLLNLISEDDNNNNNKPTTPKKCSTIFVCVH